MTPYNQLVSLRYAKARLTRIYARMPMPRVARRLAARRQYVCKVHNTPARMMVLCKNNTL